VLNNFPSFSHTLTVVATAKVVREKINTEEDSFRMTSTEISLSQKTLGVNHRSTDTRATKKLSLLPSDRHARRAKVEINCRCENLQYH
jgi:hypothetical protein